MCCLQLRQKYCWLNKVFINWLQKLKQHLCLWKSSLESNFPCIIPLQKLPFSHSPVSLLFLSPQSHSLSICQSLCVLVTTYVGLCVVKSGAVTQAMSQCITPWPMQKQHPNPTFQLSLTICNGDHCRLCVNKNNRKLASTHEEKDVYLLFSAMYCISAEFLRVSQEKAFLCALGICLSTNFSG